MKHMIRRALPVLMAAVLMITLMLPVLAGENPILVTLTVTAVGDIPDGLEITIAPEKPENPMPRTATITVRRSGETSFDPMAFTRVGIYEYNVKQTAGDSVDRREYRVVITITNAEDGEGLAAAVAVYDLSDPDHKCGEIKFVYEYEYEEPEPPETKPLETEPPETKPVETEPPETKPVETEPSETKPVETETEPVETEPEPETEPETEPEVIETEPEEPEEILVQTGQLNWPISVLSVGGMGCIAVGCVFLTGDRKKESEEEIEENEKEETDGE